MKSDTYHLKVIILAAGKSERFNGIKLLAKLNSQEQSPALITHVLQQVSKSLASNKIENSEVQIATGGYHQQLSKLINEQCPTHFCSDASLGLGHTIAQSVANIVAKNDHTSHIMITLADQVALVADDYGNLIGQSMLMPDKLICAKAQLEIMPPAIFPRSYFSQLMKLTGDKGAKALLHKNKSQLQQVSIPNAVIDIDTREDLNHWQKSHLNLSQ